jgi:hypothetical protein
MAAKSKKKPAKAKSFKKATDIKNYFLYIEDDKVKAIEYKPGGGQELQELCREMGLREHGWVADTTAKNAEIYGEQLRRD